MVELKDVNIIGFSELGGKAVMIGKSYFSPRSLMFRSSLRSIITNVSSNEFLIIHCLVE